MLKSQPRPAGGTEAASTAHCLTGQMWSQPRTQPLFSQAELLAMALPCLPQGQAALRWGRPGEGKRTKVPIQPRFCENCGSRGSFKSSWSLERPDSGNACVLPSPPWGLPQPSFSALPAPARTCLPTPRLTQPRPLNISPGVAGRHLQLRVPNTEPRTFPCA